APEPHHRRGSHTEHPMRAQRRILEGALVASVLSGGPSMMHALWTSRSPARVIRYALDATRAIGTLVPPGRPGLVTGVAVHGVISLAAGEALGVVVPEHRSVVWAGLVGLVMGAVNVGIIGRRYPAIRSLPLGPQLADNMAFGV